MASLDRGTKRQCLHCGTKFYDLNRDPVLCPSCGKVFLLTEARHARAIEREEAEAEEVEEVDAIEPDAPALTSTEDGDTEDEPCAEEDIPEVEGVEEAEDIGEDEADVFLEEEDEDEDINFDVGSGDER